MKKVVLSLLIFIQNKQLKKYDFIIFHFYSKIKIYNKKQTTQNFVWFVFIKFITNFYYTILKNIKS